MSTNNRSRRRWRSSGGAGIIVVIGIVLALSFGGFNLPIFFLALAAAALIGGMEKGKGSMYGGATGAIWLALLALSFATGNWGLMFIGIIFSGILGSTFRGGRRQGQGQEQSQSQYYATPMNTTYGQPSTPVYTPNSLSAESFPSYTEGYGNRERQPAQKQREQVSQDEQQAPTIASYETPQAQYPIQPPPEQQQR